MKSSRFALLVSFTLLSALLSSCSGHSNASSVLPLSANAAAPPQSETGARLPADSAQMTATTGNTRQSCPSVRPGDDVRCYAMLRADLPAIPFSDAATVNGYGPAEIQAAYALPSAQGNGHTVGIVDAYNDPKAEADLAVYRKHFNLPPCTGASGCFKQVGQTGGKVPPNDPGWSEEISLDLDMVSATCPNCHILLVEAKTATFADLGIAEDEAVRLGANEISNSYGGPEAGPRNPDYAHPGIVITASAGDNGTGAQQPCSYRGVVCVGGTHLVRSTTTRGWSETVWSGTGSGCSAVVIKPLWQTDLKCPRRSEADVSADADPATGVAAYDSIPYQGYVGWIEFGGTSVASPIIASVFALAGNAASQTAASGLWRHLGTADFNDVLSGSNGTCSLAWPYICNARRGYDGPSGVGTPNGLGAF